jgi:diguanylate cyclase (GGDEF)-like protein
MTTVSLPDVAAMLILMGILGGLMRRHAGHRVESWLLGLTFILVQLIASAVSRGAPSLLVGTRILSLNCFVLAAATFSWAARGAGWSRQSRVPVYLFPVVPLMALCTLYAVSAGSPKTYLWIIGVSLLVGIVYIIAVRRRRPGRLVTLAAMHCWLWLPMFLFAEQSRFRDMVYWGLCCLYLLTAFSFRRLVYRGRIGGLVIVAGFAIWGFCFALRPWLEAHPVYGSLLEETQNMQKFFVTIGMLLVLLEDETERSEQQALTDPLTGLPNRRLFDDRMVQALERARRFHTTVALFVIDLNGFKEINDSCGHATGDHALQQTSLHLKARVRSSDTVARMGGDEFCVLLAEVGESDCERIAKLLKQAVETVELPEGCPGPLSASAGYAVFPRDAETAGALLNLADARMYEEKRALAALSVRYGRQYDASLPPPPANVVGPEDRVG